MQAQDYETEKAVRERLATFAVAKPPLSARERTRRFRIAGAVALAVGWGCGLCLAVGYAAGRPDGWQTVTWLPARIVIGAGSGAAIGLFLMAEQHAVAAGGHVKAPPPLAMIAVGVAIGLLFSHYVL